MDCVRVGKISSINYKKGMVNVVYSDRDDSVTEDVSYLTFNNEYKMPEIDDMVLTLHLSNDSTIAIALGTFWNGANLPFESGKGLYRKDFSNVQGEAYMKCKDGAININAKKIALTSSDTLNIKAKEVIITTDKGVTVF